MATPTVAQKTFSSDEKIVLYGSSQEDSTMKAEEKELLSLKDKNPLYNKHIENQLLLLKENNILKNERMDQLRFLSFFENILTSKVKIEVYKFFLENGATTVRELTKGLKGSYTYYYKILDSLIDSGIIEAKHKIKSSQKQGGAPSTVYGLVSCSDREVMAASSRYLKSLSPIYASVDYLYQQTLSSIANEEIQFSKIVGIARTCKISKNRFHFMDIANEIAYKLQEKGIKVWK